MVSSTPPSLKVPLVLKLSQRGGDDEHILVFHERSLALHLPDIFSPCSGLLVAQGSCSYHSCNRGQASGVPQARKGWGSADQHVPAYQQGWQGEQVGRAGANHSHLSRHGVANGCWYPEGQHCADKWMLLCPPRLLTLNQSPHSRPWSDPGCAGMGGGGYHSIVI